VVLPVLNTCTVRSTLDDEMAPTMDKAATFSMARHHDIDSVFTGCPQFPFRHAHQFMVFAAAEMRS
jgi:hypothetical protein